jgi:hypothetical protein
MYIYSFIIYLYYTGYDYTITPILDIVKFIIIITIIISMRELIYVLIG